MVERLSIDFPMMRTYDDPSGPFVRFYDYEAFAIHAAGKATDLERQIAELRAERDEARANHEYFATQWDDRGYALKAAEAENARLRALPLKDEVETALDDLAAMFDRMADLHPSRDLREVLADPSGLAIRARALLSRLRAGEQEGWRELRIAFEAAKYVPGDHPIVPVKIDTFMKTVERLLAAAPSEQGGDRG